MGRPLGFAEWSRRLDSMGPHGAHFFCGPESLLRDTALSRLQARLFGGGEQARLGLDRFHGGESSLAQVTSSLASVGLFTGVRLVTLSDAERAGRAGAAERRELLERLRGGLEGSVFVALSELPVRELERKNDFTRGLLEACVVVEMNHPSPAEALRWLMEESARRQVRLDPEAGTLLLSRVGPTLQELSRELEKLELSVAPGEKVDAARMQEMVRRGQLGTGWEFCQSLLRGRTAETLRLWSAVQRTEPVLRTQWLLQRQARDGLARPGTAASDTRLSQLLLRAFDLERGIKTGKISSGRENIALELLVVSSGTGATRPTRGSAPTT